MENKSSVETLRKRYKYLSITLFLISLATPALYYQRENGGFRPFEDSLYGLAILINGPLGAIMPKVVSWWGWLANVFGGIALIKFSKSKYESSLFYIRRAVIISIAATWALKYDSMPFNEGFSANGTFAYFGVGYFAWIGAQLTILFGSAHILKLQRQHELPTEVVVEGHNP